MCLLGIIDIFDCSSLGGAKEFGRVAKGGRKILDASLRGGEQFWILNFLESLGKIKGHV